MDMKVFDQQITSRFAIYNADCMDVLGALPDGSVHLSIYSPPFATAGGGLFTYSSSDRDLSNNSSYGGFFEHYRFIVQEIARLTMGGRFTAVHAMDVPSGNTGRDHLIDFPGDIIRLHKEEGFDYVARHTIWKEPLAVRNRTMAKNLAHKTIVTDSAFAGVAGADYLLIFRKRGENKIPIAHPVGLTEYAGATPVPADLLKYRGWTGNQIENKFSHWIWRRYASSIWDDVRIDRVLPFRPAREPDDERHVHPLQLDVIDRCLVLRSNPGETVLTPFMGVGSEVFSAVRAGRRGIGIELKTSYYKQAVRNMAAVDLPDSEQATLFEDGQGGPDMLTEDAA